jgi:PAS domain S-box-containing protein
MSTAPSERRDAPWRWSFRAHVILLVVAGILPLAALSVYSMTRLGDSMSEMNRHQTLSTARAISSNIDQQLLVAEQNLRALAGMLPQVADDLQDFYADCRAIAEENGGWILLAYPDGRQIFNTKRPLGASLPKLGGTDELWDAVATGKPRISGAFTGVVDPQRQFSIYVPILQDGQVTHVLTMTFPTRRLNELLSQQNLPEGWTGSVVDRTGTIFARHPRPEIVGLKASAEILAMPEDQSEGFFRITNVEDTPVYIASVRSALSGWKVDVGIPQSLLDAPLRQTLQRFALLGGAVLLLAVGAAAIIGRRLAGDMKGLASAAYALAQHQRLPAVVSSVDEVNRVATALTYAEAALNEGEQQLRRNQEHLALAQRVANTGSLLRDGRTGITEWSDELYRLLGLERGAHPPTFAAVLELVHKEDRPKLVEARAALLRGERTATTQFRIVRSDGEVRVMQADISPLSGEAEPSSRTLVTFRDITELHAAEQRQRVLERQLQHAQKLDALGTLAGGIAHDLNNTLVPVMGLAKITMRHLPEGSREQANLATILRASERARDLVGQILAFSRNEAPTREPVDLAALIREALAMLRASLPATTHIVESIKAVPPVLGDAGQLHQIVINLVVNAAQAIGSEIGTITVALGAELQAIPEGAGPPARCVHLCVRDTGCGMDAATLARIFEPFFTTKPVGKGTGLGLSVVHGILSQHGGRVSVQSTVGLGARFDVYLPALADRERAPRSDVAAAE